MYDEAIIFDLDGVLIHTDHYHYSFEKLADDESIYLIKDK